MEERQTTPDQPDPGRSRQRQTPQVLLRSQQRLLLQQQQLGQDDHSFRVHSNMSLPKTVDASEVAVAASQAKLMFPTGYHLKQQQQETRILRTPPTVAQQREAGTAPIRSYAPTPTPSERWHVNHEAGLQVSQSLPAFSHMHASSGPDSLSSTYNSFTIPSFPSSLDVDRIHTDRRTSFEHPHIGIGVDEFTTRESSFDSSIFNTEDFTNRQPTFPVISQSSMNTVDEDVDVKPCLTGTTSRRSSCESLPELAVYKKQVHNAVERKRRYCINDKIAELAEMLPSKENKMSKGTILTRTLQYMKYLKDTNAKLTDQVKDLNNRLQEAKLHEPSACAAPRSQPSILNSDHNTVNSSLTRAAFSMPAFPVQPVASDETSADLLNDFEHVFSFAFTSEDITEQIHNF